MNAEKLIDFINSIKIDKSKPINEYDAYAVNSSGYIGVAIKTTEDVCILEKFNKVEISNADLTIDGVIHKTIFLFTKESYMDEHYGTLCLDFLDLKKRELISKTPLEWFKEWSELLGNIKKKKMVFDVIGEMKVLLLLQNKGLQPSWDSITMNTFDISTIEELYEVKTTTNKTTNYITIHNQFQLDDKGLNNLFIAFVRVEANENGDSIDSLFNDLKNVKYKRIDAVEKYLETIGYGIGKNERYAKYVVHEIRKYKIDDNFPKITKHSFINDKFPDGIIKFEYTVSLDSLQYSEF